MSKTFKVTGIVNEGFYDAAFVAASKTGAKLGRFTGTTLTVTGGRTKFMAAYRKQLGV